MAAPAVSASRRAAAPAPQRRARSTAASRSAQRVATPSRRVRAGSRGASSARAGTRAKAATARRSRITPPGGMAMIPVHAVGGAAGAVGGMADSGVVVSMTRGRLWIAVLGILLGGIVALNVWGLSLSASASGTASKIDELEHANTVLSAKIAKRTSSDRVQALAAGLGLEIPTPKAVNYLKARDGDAANAAERLAAGEISVLDGLPIATAFADASLAGADLEASDASIDPLVPAVTDPAALAPAPTDPATPLTPLPAAPATSPEPAAPPSAPGAPLAPPAGGGVAP